MVTLVSSVTPSPLAPKSSTSNMAGFEAFGDPVTGHGLWFELGGGLVWPPLPPPPPWL